MWKIWPETLNEFLGKKGFELKSFNKISKGDNDCSNFFSCIIPSREYS